MNTLLHFLVEHGPMLAIGVTLLLAVGGIASLLNRAPIHRQRTGELTIVAVLAWIALACIPLPRWSAFAFSSQPPPEIVSPTPQDSTSAPTPLAVDIANESLADEAARIQETAEILTQLAQLDAEQQALGAEPATLPPIDAAPQEAVTSPPQEPATGQAVVIAQSPAVAPAVGEFSWRQIVATVYLALAAFCLLWIAFGWLMLRRLTRRAAAPQQWLQQLYASLSPAPLPRLLVSSNCRRAFSYGFWRPTIMLPADCCQENRAEQLRQILLHELAHLGQGDQRGRVLFNIALPLLYAHPLYWWIRSRTYLAAELVADDWAAGHSSTTAYAGELIALVKEQGRRGLAHVGTVGIFSSPTQFYRRMEMLVRRQTPLMTTCTRRWRLLTTLTAAVAVILLSSTLGVQLVQAEPDDGDKQADTADASSADTPADADTDSADADDDQPTTPEKSEDDKFELRGSGRLGGRGLRGGGRGGLRGGGRRGRDDDDDRGGSGFNRGNRRLPVTWHDRGPMLGRPNISRAVTPDDILANAKSIHRDVLIMRLQLISRRPTEREKVIRQLLTAENASDAEVIEQLYEKVLQRPADDEEIALIQQILSLSDNRVDSIRHVLESLGAYDDAARSAVHVLTLESELTEAEAQLREMTEQITSLLADLDLNHLNTADDVPYAVRKQLKIKKHPDEKISSWQDVFTIMERSSGGIDHRVLEMKKKLADLAELDKQAKNKQMDSSDRRFRPYVQAPTPRTAYPSPKRSTRKVTKMVPRVVEPKTDDGRTDNYTVYEAVEVEVPVLENPEDPKLHKGGKSEPDTTATPAARPAPGTPEESGNAGNTDVVSIVLDYAATKNKLALAQEALANSERLKEKGYVTKNEFTKAEADFNTQKQRLVILQQVAEVLMINAQAELEAAKTELDEAANSKDKVKILQAQTKVTRAEGNIRILATIK